MPSVIPASHPPRVKPTKPSIVIPPTPKHINASFASDVPTTTEVLPVTVSALPIPPRLPSMPNGRIGATPMTPQSLPHVMASDIASTDLTSIAELFSVMKSTARTLSMTFNNLGKQVENMASMAPAIKAADQINGLRAALYQQIKRQEASMQGISLLLESAIHEGVVLHLKKQIFSKIQEKVAIEVKDRVRQELAAQVPAHLQHQAHNHDRQVLKAQTTIHNLEVRHHNASIKPTEPLRPLLRPLPTPEQSPTYVVKRLAQLSPIAATPFSAFPRVPASTPIVPKHLTIPGWSANRLAPLTPSPLFPRDLKSLVSLGPEVIKLLFKDYGIDKDESHSSLDDEPRPKAAFEPVDRRSSAEETQNTHEQDVKKFMFHIGVRDCDSSDTSLARPKLHISIPV